MAKTLTAEDDDGEELVLVETPTLPKEPPAGADTQPADSDDPEDDDDEDEDERLAVSQDDADAEVVSKNRQKRAERRKRQRLAEENAKRELRELRDLTEAQAKRLAALEGNALNQNEATIDRQIEQAQAEARQAAMILAKAIQAGNDDDAAAAMEIRDQAKAKEMKLSQAKDQIKQARETPQGPRHDPVVVNYGRQWMAQNPWFDPKGSDEASRITNEIDIRLTKEGYDPKAPGYWQELTRRVTSRFEAAKTGNGAGSQGDAAPKKKAPPLGNGREHAPQGTRREVYVTPERKQAMIDAGVWDDPERRAKMLKAYSDYDKNNKAR